MARKDIKVAVVGDASQLKRELGKAEAQIASFGGGAKRAGLDLKDLFLSGAAVLGAKKLADGAAQLEQAVGGTTAVFGDASGAIDEFAESAAEAAGLSERAARDLTSRLGASLVGVGFEAGEAAKQAVFLTQTGADLAATLGGTTEEAVTALAATLRGEFDPIERYIGGLRMTEVTAKAVSLGLAESAESADSYAKAQAILALVTEKAAFSQNRYAEELSTASGAAKTAGAQAQNAADDLGEAFLPIYTKIAEVVGATATAFQALPDPVQTGSVALLGVALVGPKVAGAFTAVKAATLGLPAAFTKAGVSATFAKNSIVSMSVATKASALSAAGAVGIYAALFLGGRELNEMLNGDFGDGGLDSYVEALRAAGNDGKVIGVLAEDMGDLNAAINTMKSYDKFFDPLTKLFQSGNNDKAAGQIDKLDQALKSLFADDPSKAATQYQAILQALGLSAADGERFFGDYAAAIDEAEAAQAEAASGGKAVVVELDRTSEAYKKAADAARDAAEEQAKGARDVFDAQRRYEDSTRDVESAQRRLNDVQRAGSDINRQQRSAALSLAQAQEEVYDVQRRISGLPLQGAEADLDLRDARLGVTEAEERLNETRADGKSTTTDVARAEIALERSRLRVIGAERAIEDVQRDQATVGLELASAQLSVEEAQSDLNSAQELGVQYARDIEEAQRGVEDAMLGQTEAAADLLVAQVLLANDGHLPASEKARLQAEKLQELANTLAPGSPLRTQLQGFIDTLNAVPTEKEIAFKLDVEQALAQLAFLEQTVIDGKTYELRGPGLTEVSPLKAFLDGLQPRALGGPVSRNGTYMVGEKGPELFTPGQSGYITPNGATGDNNTFNIYATGDARATAIEIIRQRRAQSYLVGAR